MKTLVCVLICCLSAFCTASANAQENLGSWIWHPGDSTADQIKVRKSFTVDGAVKTAVAVATADNQFTLHINGKRVLAGRDWNQLELADVKSAIKPGKNVIAIEGRNEGGPAALMCRVLITMNNKTTKVIATDGSWASSIDAKGDWKKTDLDDSDWTKAKVIGRVGQRDLPWTGAVNGQTLAAAMQDSGDPATFKPRLAEGAKTAEGFKLEKIYQVPRAFGSWVSITQSPDGGLYACDQGRAGIYKIWPGTDDKETKVEKQQVDLSGAQGLLWAFDCLYAVVNGGQKSGLHRLTDKDGDGNLDHDEHLMFVPGGGEHGPHAVILSPDKKSLFVCAGNHTELPESIAGSRIPRNWGEDLLLPRRWDANGHAAGRLAPGGWVCKVDPDGKSWEVYSMGYRNQYDIAFHADGELFSYDADMEWDMGSPWYRPTRVVHATSGSEFGWRSGTGKWPTYYEDSLPAAVEIGPGSPVGIVFGYGAKFPAKYQRALFILDWTYSTIYAIHLTPDGSTYVGKHEDFVTGQPLQVTDAAIGTDGNMYFAVGGRGTQSALYRVSYVGDASTAPVDASNSNGRELRQLRQQLESLHGEDQAGDAGSIDQIVSQLGHEDRFIRYAARIALEARNVDLWRDKITNVENPRAKINAAIALSRQGSSDDLPTVLSLLKRVGMKGITEQSVLGMLRAYQLAFTRLGAPGDEVRAELLRKFDSMYVNPSDSINAELVQLLVYLDSPNVVSKTLGLIDRMTSQEQPIPDWGYLVERHKNYGGTVGRLLENMPPARAIHHAFVLRNQKTGWTLDQRKRYLEFLVAAAKFPGGNSYTKFISQFRDDALKTFSPAELVTVGDLASVSLLAQPPKVDPPKGPGRKWTRDAAMPLVGNLKKRSFDRGRNLFHATQCAKCHRLGGEGGAIGPDLSTAGRKYPMPDLLDAIIEPSKAISDQYGSEKILTSEGQSIVGRVVRLEGKLHVYTIDANAPPTIIDEDDVEQIQPSKISQMPTGLIDSLNEEELKDLVAYILSGGNRRDKVYR